MAKMLICSRRWAFFVPVGFINGSGVNSKIGVSTVSVVRRIRDARLFKRSRTSEIFDMPKLLICSDRVLFSDLAIASKSRFSSYVHLKVMLSVNFSDIARPHCCLIAPFRDAVFLSLQRFHKKYAFPSFQFSDHLCSSGNRTHSQRSDAGSYLPSFYLEGL